MLLRDNKRPIPMTSRSFPRSGVWTCFSEIIMGWWCIPWYPHYSSSNPMISPQVMVKPPFSSRLYPMKPLPNPQESRFYHQFLLVKWSVWWVKAGLFSPLRRPWGRHSRRFGPWWSLQPLVSWCWRWVPWFHPQSFRDVKLGIPGHTTCEIGDV